ncbi:PaaI family thioesterase [Alkalicoccobacillus plakortidis]|uniref:PaaI family thioesterase n=1 Tax=Alkalicoccobacillus plakortidis TaxID=444060 RepID=A0ABT0XPC4_9BACI|nr:PaaI family thioesterase [Alkalicoccobacillus plakortidis]MCM2677550.1 PaaI family thioesterase [Alkalicoccobacillus plakortidis]
MANTSSTQRDVFIEKATELAERTFWGHVGCEMIELEERQVTVELDVKSHHLNLIGILHGGVHATMLDSAMGILAMASNPEDKMVTTNLNIHYLAPTKEEKVRVQAKIIHESNSMMTTEGTLVNEAGELCAFATATFRRS